MPRGEDPTLRDCSTTGWIDDLEARLRRYRHASRWLPDWGSALRPTYAVHGLSATFLRLPARSAPIRLRRVHNLLASADVRCVAELTAPERLPWEAASQLGARDGVSVLNVEQGLQSDPGRTNN